VAVRPTRYGGPGLITPGTPSLLRAINERSALELLHQLGPLSRAEIARRTGLSKPTVSLALARLEQAGLVREAGRTSGGKGATALLYELDPRAGWILGLDVGRGFIRCAIADITGALAIRRDERAQARTGPALISQVGSLARRTAAEAGIGLADVTRAAMGSPGVLQPGRERVALAPNLPGWQRPGVLDAIRAELGIEVAFENDVNLAAIGERWHGLGRQAESFVLLSIGTGVGMGVVLGGELYRGASGSAGEIGYLPVGVGDPHDPATRRTGAFEAAVGAEAVVRLARELGLAARSAKQVFAVARRGDPVALRVVDQEARRLALGIAAVAAVLDPELVVLGGGIGAGGGDLLLEPLARELRACSPFRPRVAVSALGDEAVLYGALAIALAAAQEQVLGRVYGRSDRPMGPADRRKEAVP
jgi:predicted NBD/HSP70 family sugar kinase